MYRHNVKLENEFFPFLPNEQTYKLPRLINVSLG